MSRNTLAAPSAGSPLEPSDRDPMARAGPPAGGAAGATLEAVRPVVRQLVRRFVRN